MLSLWAFANRLGLATRTQLSSMSAAPVGMWEE